MGQSQGKVHSLVLHEKQLVQRCPLDLEFSSDTSYILSCGVDCLKTSVTTKKLSDSLQTTIGVPSSNCEDYIIASESKNPIEEFHGKFCEAASNVSPEGIFVFTFNGYGMVDGKEYGLTVSSCGIASSFVSAATIAGWLHEACFKGKCALLVLDLCYQEGLAEKIQFNDLAKPFDPDPNMIVLTSAMSCEVQNVASVFGVSLFTLFFTACLLSSSSRPGLLKLKSVYDECNECCSAFSSLLITYSAKSGLKWSTIQMELKQFHLKQSFRDLIETNEDIDSSDSSADDRFQFVKKYYDYKKSPVIIHDKCQAWLEIVSSPGGPLEQLKDRHLFEEGDMKRLLLGSMMYSMGSFFIACDQPNISDSNTFIVAFVHVLAVLDTVYMNIGIMLEDMTVALQCYMDLLQDHKIQIGGLNGLLSSIKQ